MLDAFKRIDAEDKLDALWQDKQDIAERVYDLTLQATGDEKKATEARSRIILERENARIDRMI